MKTIYTTTCLILLLPIFTTCQYFNNRYSHDKKDQKNNNRFLPTKSTIHHRNLSISKTSLLSSLSSSSRSIHETLSEATKQKTSHSSVDQELSQPPLTNLHRPPSRSDHEQIITNEKEPLVTWKKSKGIISFEIDQRHSKIQNDDHCNNNDSTTITATTNSTSSLQKFDNVNSNSIQSFHRNHPSVDLSWKCQASMDPLALIRFVFLGLKSGTSFLSAVFGTLRLLAPMVVARRILSLLGYMLFDYYTGWYLRTQYNKRMKHATKYDIPAGLRATGRLSLQLFVMFCAGKCVEFILDQVPCWMDDKFCHWWFGLVWIVAISVAGHVTGIMILPRIPLLQIKPVVQEVKPSPKRILVRPWHALSVLRDPEEWFCSIAASTNPRAILRRRAAGAATTSSNIVPISVNPLLFPSTWQPLRIITCLGVIFGIESLLHQNNVITNYTKERRGMILRQFMVHVALQDEWYRVLQKEQRVSLAAFIHSILFLSSVLLFVTVEGFASILCGPIVVATLFTSWINMLLSYERLDTKQFPFSLSFLNGNNNNNQNNNNNNNNRARNKRKGDQSISGLYDNHSPISSYSASLLNIEEN